VFKWTKLGRIFDPTAYTDRPWMAEFAQAPCTLMLDDRVRVYFSCRPPPDANGQYASRSAFVDLDRNNLQVVLEVSEQPILELGNIGTFDEFGTYPVSVIRNSDSIRAYYAGWTRCESVPFDVAIGVADSTNGGVTFQKLGHGPVLSSSLDEPFVLSGPKIRRWNEQWVLYYIAGRRWIVADNRPEPVYRIRMAVSDDGLNWTRTNVDLIEHRIEPDEAQASPDVYYDGRRYHMFFCYRYSTGYRSAERGYRIGYASSTNGTDWIRDDAIAGLDVSEAGWDSEMVSYPHVFQLDGTTYMMYLGNGVGRYGFGLARLEGSL